MYISFHASKEIVDFNLKFCENENVTAIFQIKKFTLY